MANEKNLIPQAHKLTVEEASRGGKKSVRVRQEKKTIQKILEAYLDTPIKKNGSLDAIAAKVGIKGDKSIKELFAAVCVINTMKKCDLGDLETLSKLLGENGVPSGDNEREDDALTKALKEEAERMQNADK